MKEKIKKYASYAGTALIILLVVLGAVIGGAEVRDKAIATGLLVAVTGIPYLIYSIIHGTNTSEQVSEEGLDLTDDSWAGDKYYGYNKDYAITVKNLDEYLAGIETLRGTQITWKKDYSDTVTCANYNHKETRIEIVKVKAGSEHMPKMYFIEGCKENSSNIPYGYRSKVDIASSPSEETILSSEEALYSDARPITEERTKREEANTKPSFDTQETRHTCVATNDPAVNDSKKAIPSDMLRKLKTLYDQGVLTEEEFKEKKKQILNI